MGSTVTSQNVLLTIRNITLLIGCIKDSSLIINELAVVLTGYYNCLSFRCLQEVHLDKHIKLLDCPGIVMATSTTDAAMILRNCVKIEQLVDPLPPVEAILRRCNKTQVCDGTSPTCIMEDCVTQTLVLLDVQIMEHYGVPDFHTPLEFLALLARRQGKLRKGGLPDSDKAAKSVLMDWTGLVNIAII